MQDISSIKQRYRELFHVAHERLQDLFLTLQATHHCDTCLHPPEKVEDPLHADCGYREWQKTVIVTLEKTIGQQILATLEKITASREELGGCHQCGVCCNLASSEFSYDQLLEKAEKGDTFAQQFTSIFLPYTSQEAALQKFPEIVQEILTQTEGDVHFYHCPYVTEDNRCSIYRDPMRPEICATYPDTPLVLMYKNCGYQPWKQAMLPTTLLAHATLELCQHYVHKIDDALRDAANV